MKNSKSRFSRKRWSTPDRVQLLTEYHESKLTQRDFAKRYGLGLSTLCKWLRDENKGINATKVKFQEVAMCVPPLRWPVEVVSPHGWIVRLQNSQDAESLPQLLQSLPCLA